MSTADVGDERGGTEEPNQRPAIGTVVRSTSSIERRGSSSSSLSCVARRSSIYSERSSLPNLSSVPADHPTVETLRRTLLETKRRNRTFETNRRGTDQRDRSTEKRMERSESEKCLLGELLRETTRGDQRTLPSRPKSIQRSSDRTRLVVVDRSQLGSRIETNETSSRRPSKQSNSLRSSLSL